MKFRSISLLVIAELAAMSLWFVSAAILPDMLREADMGASRQAALSSAVQAGFVVGALVSAIFGFADRHDPRHVFAITAIGAAAMNVLLIVVPPGSIAAIAVRFATGALLAGVYPVGMKIAVGWSARDRAFLVGLLVGALTLGSASPFLMAFFGGGDWRAIVVWASLASAFAGLLCLFVRLGPYHQAAAAFDPRAILIAWTNRRVRLAYLGYLGHMWELYAMWAWIAAAASASYAMSMAESEATDLGKFTAFCAIGLGGFACVAAGVIGDRWGKAEMAAAAMAVSAASALLVAWSFGGPPWLTFTLAIIWGLSVVPDSAQFSALVADASPPEVSGSLLTLQTALGFGLTIATVQLVPFGVEAFGWPVTLSVLAAGPLFGIWAMLKLRALENRPEDAALTASK